MAAGACWNVPLSEEVKNVYAVNGVKEDIDWEIHN